MFLSPILVRPELLTASADALLLRANPRLVNFDNAAHLLNHRVLRHAEPDTVKHKPAGFVTDSRRAVDLVCAHTFFGSAEQTFRTCCTHPR